MYVRPPSPKKNQQSTKKSSQIIADMEQRINLNCSICSHTFNTTNRIPKIVCRRQHTYCAECVCLLQRVRPCRCPECRFKIYEQNIFVNRALFAVCEYFPILKKQIDQQYEENDRLKKINQQISDKLELSQKSHNFIHQNFNQNKQKYGKSSREQKRIATITKPQQKKSQFPQELIQRKMSKISKDPINPQQSTSIAKKKNRTFKRIVEPRQKNRFIQVFNPIVRNFRGIE